MDWSMEQVKFWLEWAISQFSLEGVAVEQFDLTGIELCQLSHDDFIQLVPNDIDNIFWTHLELLRKCKFVGMHFSVLVFNDDNEVLFYLKNIMHLQCFYFCL